LPNDVRKKSLSLLAQAAAATFHHVWGSLALALNDIMHRRGFEKMLCHGSNLEKTWPFYDIQIRRA
jgi:hypothetical protein